jgi:hypothetical protein
VFPQAETTRSVIVASAAAPAATAAIAAVVIIAAVIVITVITVIIAAAMTRIVIIVIVIIVIVIVIVIIVIQIIRIKKVLVAVADADAGRDVLAWADRFRLGLQDVTRFRIIDCFDFFGATNSLDLDLRRSLLDLDPGKAIGLVSCYDFVGRNGESHLGRDGHHHAEKAKSAQSAFHMAVHHRTSLSLLGRWRIISRRAHGFGRFAATEATKSGNPGNGN